MLCQTSLVRNPVCLCCVLALLVTWLYHWIKMGKHVRHLLPGFEETCIHIISGPRQCQSQCTASFCLAVTVARVNHLLCIWEITYNKSTLTCGLVIPLLTVSNLCVLFLQDKQINSSEVKLKELTEQNTKLQRSHHTVQVGWWKNNYWSIQYFMYINSVICTAGPMSVGTHPWCSRPCADPEEIKHLDN